MATKNHVQDNMSELAGNFKAADTNPDQELLIHSILGVRFDTILSTNYSLEFEKTTFPTFSEGKEKAIIELPLNSRVARKDLVFSNARSFHMVLIRHFGISMEQLSGKIYCHGTALLWKDACGGDTTS